MPRQATLASLVRVPPSRQSAAVTDRMICARPRLASRALTIRAFGVWSVEARVASLPTIGAVGPYARARAHPCIEVWRPRQSRDHSSGLRDDSFVSTNLPGSATETYDGSESMSSQEDANVGQRPDAGEWRERDPPLHVRERVGGIAEHDGPEDEVRTEEHLVA